MNTIKIILMQTSHPGNIGAAARAMKVMGLSQLILVDPQCDPHDGLAKAMAAGAEDIWQRATVCENLEDALTGCHTVFGATARTRTFAYGQVLAARAAARRIVAASSGQVAILFGCERSGLPNEALSRCHYSIRIPTSDDYVSLNLAQAVQIVVYELLTARTMSEATPTLHTDDAEQTQSKQAPAATAEELDGTYRHLERIMKQTGFYKPDHPRRMEARLRRLLRRARPDRQDINLLRGIFDSIERIRRRQDST